MYPICRIVFKGSESYEQELVEGQQSKSLTLICIIKMRCALHRRAAKQEKGVIIKIIKKARRMISRLRVLFGNIEDLCIIICLSLCLTYIYLLLLIVWCIPSSLYLFLLFSFRIWSKLLVVEWQTIQWVLDCSYMLLWHCCSILL